MGYTLGFYRVTEPVTNEVERETLTALDRLEEGFFPAGMWLSRDRKLVLADAGSYSRDLIPTEYFVSPGVATLPLEPKNGTRITFTESDEPDLYPASLVIECSLETMTANGWGADRLLRILRETVGSFHPDYAYLYADAHRGRDSYRKRMFAFDLRQVPIGVFWMNYYGPQWVKNLGAETIEKIKASVPLFEALEEGGVLFAIQEEPYQEEIAAHREHQSRLETELGLAQIQDRFPNSGMEANARRSR